MKKTKIIIALLMAVMLSGLQMTSVSAIENISTETVEKINSDSNTTTTTNTEDSYLTVDENGTISNPADTFMQKVTVEEFNDKISSKMAEIIAVVQNFGLPACILCFIVSLIVTVFGVFTKRGAIMQGFIAMGVCVLCYVCIRYAYDIVAFLSGWLVS